MGIAQLITQAVTGIGIPDLVAYLFFLGIGLFIIIKGGDWFVDAASWFAEISGIPKLIVGATVVSIATTLPELLVSLFAAIDGHGILVAGDAASAEAMVDMAIGNAVGSVTANLGLILGIAMVCMPSVIRRKDYALKMGLMCAGAGVIVLFGILSYIGVMPFNFVPSLLLVLIFVTAMWENVHSARAEMKLEGENIEKVREKPDGKTVRINVLKFLVGTACIVLGADLLVQNAGDLARFVGIDERVISVTLVAIGTSLPELVTTVTAIAKKQSSLSAGNILGANIIDLALILPLCSLVYGGSLPVSPSVARIDLPACLIMCAVAVVPSLITKKFSRVQGFCMLGLYAVYLVITTVIAA